MERGRPRLQAEGDNPIPHPDSLSIGEGKLKFKDRERNPAIPDGQSSRYHYKKPSRRQEGFLQ